MRRTGPGCFLLVLAFAVGLPGPLRAAARAEASAGSTGAARPWKDALPAERAADLARLTQEPAGWPRVRAVSAHLLGTPYQSSPLGEGPGSAPDPDPRVRFDRMDCLTFVETALALGHAATPAEAEALLDDVRYRDGAAPSYASRLHFFEAQWLPEQLRKGWLADVTRELGGAAVEEAAIEFERAGWEARGAKATLGLSWEAAPKGRFSLPFVPLARARALADRLPEGLVLSVVREPSPRTATIVSHTGLVVVKDGRRFLRHARQGRAVIDEPLERFLERHARMTRWKVRGVHLLAVRDNGARAARILAPTSPPGAEVEQAER